MVKQFWNSFRRQTLLQQIWCGCWVLPVNLASIGFAGQGPYGDRVMIFALLGALGCVAIMMSQKGVTKLNSLPKLIFWTPLIFMILMINARYNLDPIYTAYLMILAATNLVQLVLSYHDWLGWWRGDRQVL